MRFEPCAIAALFLAILAGCAGMRPAETRNDLVALVTKADGSVGSVVVYQGKERLVLDTANAAAHIRSSDAMDRTTVAPAQLRASFGPVLGSLPRRPQDFVLYFVEGKDELTPESKAAIDAVREQILRRPAPEITVTGHTDNIGSDRFNDQLSFQRANKVSNALIRAGVNPGLITTVGRGSRAQLYPTPVGKPEPRNRRVEITAR
jgi:outer membrane protein OmpA-like peptidoglycan-associated protein